MEFDSPGGVALNRQKSDESTRTLMALVEAVDQRDGHIAGHCERLAQLAVKLGMALGLNEVSLLHLYHAGYMHDIGKIGIPDSILLKPGRLTAEEWTVMRTHSARGVEICRHLPSLAPVLPAIRHHHEKWDGTGYPDGLRGEQIPLLARVLQVADIYDALIHPRPYKPAFSAEKAVRILKEETECGWRDPRVVATFLELHTQELTPEQEDRIVMEGSLASLQKVLSDRGNAAINGRTSFHPLRSGWEAGFPVEVEGTSRME